MDWFQCRLSGEDSSKFTWGEFLRAAVYCTNEYGSALFDATLGDQDVIDEMYEQAIKDQSSKKRPKDADQEFHPSRRGYTREVEALMDVADNIIALRAESGKWKQSSTRFSERPLFPSAAVQDKMRKRNRSIRDDRIAAAQARWKRKNDSSPPRS